MTVVVKKPGTRAGKVAVALGIALSFGSVITGVAVATNDQPAAPRVEQVKPIEIAATTDPSDPVGLCRITKACSQ